MHSKDLFKIFLGLIIILKVKNGRTLCNYIVSFPIESKMTLNECFFDLPNISVRMVK